MNVRIFRCKVIWIIVLMMIPSVFNAQNAPIATIATVTACPSAAPGTTTTVYVTVVDFTAINSVDLTIGFNNSVMTFDSALSTVNPALSGAVHDSTIIGPGPMGRIGIQWNSLNQASLANGSVLATLVFHYINGTSALSFNPSSCEYVTLVGYLPVTLNTIPASTYFHDGQVSSAALAGSVAGGSTIYYGSSTGTLTLSGYSGSVVKWQKQYNGEGYTDIAVTTPTYSETPAYTGTWDYRAVVQNSPCAAQNSTPTTVTVLTPVGTSKTWTGTTSTDWKTPTNWSPPGTPITSDNVIIPTVTTPAVYPVIISPIVGCNDLHILTGATLTIPTLKNLNIAGTLTIE